MWVLDATKDEAACTIGIAWCLLQRSFVKISLFLRVTLARSPKARIRAWRG